MALADFQDLVDDLVRDDTGKIAAADRDAAIALAVERYSKDRPRGAVEDLAAGASATDRLDLPAGWQADFSQLQSLEYPVGDNPPTLIAGWRLYDEPAATRILLPASVAAGATVRAAYTIRHRVDAGEDTVPQGDRQAVASWAAAVLCEQLAAYFSGASDSTLQADVVDHGGKGAEFARRAKALYGRYFDDLGVDDSRLAPAGTVVDLDQSSSLGGPRLTHRRR